MSGLLKHVFASVVADSVTATEIQPQRDWNDFHVFSGGNSGSLLLRDTSDAVYGGAWLASVAVGKVLVSGGAGSAPAWSATPTLTSLTLSSSGGSSVVLTNPSNNNLTCSGDFQCSNFYAIATGVMGWVNRVLLEAPGIGQFTVENYAGSAGVGCDVSTDALLKLRTRAYSAYATLDCLGLKASGVAGANFGPAHPASITIVNGIVTAAS